jgi:hypothetical protein
LIRPGSFWRQNQEWKDQTTSTHHGERNLFTITERTLTNLVCHFLDWWTIKSTFLFLFCYEFIKCLFKEYAQWDMIICSNCDCSKNLLDTILLLLDTVRAIIFFLVNCSNPVNLWGWTGFKQFNF